MNEIIESLITWCFNNKFAVTLDVFSKAGGFWVTVTLTRGVYHIKHYFYIAGGVMSVDNWRNSLCDKELACFLEEAEREINKMSEA